MLAPAKQNQQKTTARKAKIAEPARGSANSRETNPVWQSLALNVVGIQPKLAVGEADSPYEREADQIADRIMRKATPPISDSECSLTSLTSARAQRKCNECEDEDAAKVQRKTPEMSADSPQTAPPIVNQALNAAGQPLDPMTRSFFEPRFGYDFSGVRVHTNAEASQSASAVNARAYTAGLDVVFGSNQYSPATAEGRRLLAHELTHVVQQHAAGGVQAQKCLMREAISLRSTNLVTDTAPAPTDNKREEVLDLLDRLHMLWSIDNTNFNNQYRYISALAAGAQVPQTDSTTTPPWSFQPTMDALRRNREPTLAAPVINHHMGGLRVSDSVGRGLTNNKADVLAVQDRLNFIKPYPAYASEHAAVMALTTTTVPDSALAGTYTAITEFKIGIASGTAGWQTTRASESEFGGDRFAGQTTTHTITVLANHTANDSAASETQEAIQVSIFLPAGLAPGRNKVFLFFSPGAGTETAPDRPGSNATNVHAIRSGADASEWIVIGIPGFRAATAEKGWNTINTAGIQSCLSRAGRGTQIDALRLAGHSRGGRGLTRTVGRRLIDVGLIDRVIMLDQPHPGLGTSLRTGVPAGTTPAPITDYTQGPAGGAGTALKDKGVRAIGFARLVQDRPDVPPPAAAATLLQPILADLPPRGSFTTQPVAAGTPGRVNIHDWIRTHTTAVDAIALADERAQTEWRRWIRAPSTTLNRAIVDPSPWFHVNTQNLMRFFSGPLIDASGAPVEFGFSLGIYSHHLFVAEVSEELFQ